MNLSVNVCRQRFNVFRLLLQSNDKISFLLALPGLRSFNSARRWGALSRQRRQRTSATPNHHCHHEPGVSQCTQPWRTCCREVDDTLTLRNTFVWTSQTNRNRHASPAVSHAPADAAIFPCFHLGQLLNSLRCLIHWSITEKHFEKHRIKIGRYCTCRCVCGTELTLWGTVERKRRFSHRENDAEIPSDHGGVHNNVHLR